MSNYRMKQSIIIILVLVQSNFLFAQPYNNSGQLEGIMNLRESNQVNIDRQFADLDLFMSIASVYLDELPAWKRFIGKEAKLYSYCIEGDCKNGYGKRILERNGITSLYIGNFYIGVQNGLGALYLVDGNRLILSNYCEWVLNSPGQGIHNKFDIRVNSDRSLKVRHNEIFIGSLDDFMKSKGTMGTIYTGPRKSGYNNNLNGPEEFMTKQVGFFSKQDFKHGDTFTDGIISSSRSEKTGEGKYQEIEYYENGKRRLLTTIKEIEADLVYYSFDRTSSYIEKNELNENGLIEEYFNSGEIFYRTNKDQGLPKGDLEIYDEQGKLKVKGEINSSRNKRKRTYNLNFQGTFDYLGKEYVGEISLKNLSRSSRGNSKIYQLREKSKIEVVATRRLGGEKLKEKILKSDFKRLNQVSCIFKMLFQTEL